MDFSDQVVWITGASSGIGEHLAYALAEQGARLVLSSRKEDELNRVRQNCGSEADILILPFDIQDFSAMPDYARQVIDRFDFINLLINNAGVSQRALAKETDFAVDRQIMNVNYLGAVALTKAVLPYMLRQNFGQIAVVSSVTGKIGTPYRSAYAASKHALHGFFDSLRAELVDDNISVTILCPGYVRTNVTINALQGDGSLFRKMSDSTRAGMHPAVFAQKALAAIAARREEALLAGYREAAAVYLKRLAPRLLSRVVSRAKVT